MQKISRVCKHIPGTQKLKGVHSTLILNDKLAKRGVENNKKTSNVFKSSEWNLIIIS